MRSLEKRWIGGALTALALVFAVAIAVGVGYEEVARRRDRERFPQIGRPVDIGGRTLNIYCSGEGSPTVVLESDALAPGYGWLFIQREIAKVTRACWYDRAGYGWSDPGPAPHTSTMAAQDLHELLRAAGLQPPYLLVGDGFGSLNVRVYNGLYPDGVTGMVLVDPIHEEEERMGMAGRIPFHLGYPPDLVLRTVSRIGLMRLLNLGRRRALPHKGLTPGERAILSGLEREPKIRAAFLAEEGFSKSLEEVRAAGGLGSRPLIVLRSEDSAESLAGQGADETRWARLSTRGREVVVRGSDHNIQYEAPDAVVGAVRDVVAELRGKP
ncbi:MAG: alpha/beta hydrolase [Acidobacteriia bacterium]|nr:alpha/beta hydrolase [Terriglobia bacterium]